MVPQAKRSWFREGREGIRAHSIANYTSTFSSPEAEINGDAAIPALPPRTVKRPSATFSLSDVMDSLRDILSRQPSGLHAKKKEYEIYHDKILGSGGYSVVKLARWKARDNMEVAMKIVDKSKILDAESYWSIIHAGHGAMHHPNICSLLDSFESTRHWYLAFPLCTGGELINRIINEGKYSEEDSKKVIKVILETLAYVHSKGIIHRDIKPENFLYRIEDSPVDDLLLADFGISKTVDLSHPEEDPLLFEVAGTPGYQAPEVFTGAGYRKNADVFGVGILLFGLLSATSPWSTRVPEALITECAEGVQKFADGSWVGISETAKDYIRWLAEVDPTKRPSAKEALNHEWLRLPVVASPVAPPPTDLPASPTPPEPIPLQRHDTIKPEFEIARVLTRQFTRTSVKP